MNIDFLWGFIAILLLLIITFFVVRGKTKNQYNVTIVFKAIYHCSFFLLLLILFIVTSLMTSYGINNYQLIAENLGNFVPSIIIYILLVFQLLFSVTLYTRKAINELDNDIFFKLSWKTFLSLVFYSLYVIYFFSYDADKFVNLLQHPPVIISFLGATIIVTYTETCVEALGKIAINNKSTKTKQNKQ